MASYGSVEGVGHRLAASAELRLYVEEHLAVTATPAMLCEQREQGFGFEVVKAVLHRPLASETMSPIASRPDLGIEVVEKA